MFADFQTFITSGTDCTISIWTYSSTTKSVDLLPRATLFGHRSPVVILSVSRSFSTILSVSKDGNIMLWDLNRLEFVRSLPAAGNVDVSSHSAAIQIELKLFDKLDTSTYDANKFRM